MVNGTKMRVIFVAGLEVPSSGLRGGQLTSARNLAHSQLKELAEFILIDSATTGVRPQFERMRTAAVRLYRFVRALPRADVALIFCADGLSLVEKTLMAVVARLCGRGV